MKVSVSPNCLVLTILFLLSGCATVPVPASSGYTESEYQGSFGLSYYDHGDETLQWFGSRGLQGGGYTWEALVQAAFELEPSPLDDQIELDSEGDAFNAYAKSVEARARLRETVERLVNDVDFRLRCLEQAENGGYLE